MVNITKSKLKICTVEMNLQIMEWGGQAIQLLQPVLCQQNQSSNMLHSLIVIAMRNNSLTFIHIFTYHICMSRLYEFILILTRFYLQSEIF